MRMPRHVDKRSLGLIAGVEICLRRARALPKRPHGRPPKGRNRARRMPPPPRPASNGTASSSVLTDEPVIAAQSTPAASAPQPRSGPRPATATRRPPSQSRTPATTINYAYLMRDIRSLAVLAPTMVVVLILAFIFLH